jgi:invasion protein IalB
MLPVPTPTFPVASRLNLVQENERDIIMGPGSSVVPKLRKSVSLATAAMLAVIVGSAAAQAQQQPAPRPAPPPRPAMQAQAPSQPQSQPAAQGDAPQSTTATYGDWVVQCQTQAGPPPQKLCDMAQVAQAQVQGRTVPFSRIGIARPAKGEPVRFIVQVPVNVSFATNVRIQTADADPGIVAPFARCLPSGCFAEFDLKEEMLRKFRAAAAGGKLTFADAGGHEISAPVSFSGFAQALDALLKE